MAMSGDLRVSAIFSSYHKHPLRSCFPLLSSKVEYNGFPGRGSGTYTKNHRWPGVMLDRCETHDYSRQCSRITGESKLSAASVSDRGENFLLQAINMTFFERLNLAWKLVFPSPARRKSSNARIAKQRLKMILFSDRCAVSEEAKRKIVNNIVHALSEFVDIESQDKVQLSVTADSDLGTVYSVTVPVRRVRAEYQEAEEVGSITNIEYRDTGETAGSVDMRFDFFIPDDRSR